MCVKWLYNFQGENHERRWILRNGLVCAILMAFILLFVTAGIAIHKLVVQIQGMFRMFRCQAFVHCFKCFTNEEAFIMI